jgi:hypothetical protein
MWSGQKLSGGVIMILPIQSSRVVMEDMLLLVGLKVLEQVVLIFM